MTDQDSFGKRQWVKVWTNEWLDGTTRYEMTGAQRAFWIDLLAMAGRSRYPGIICAGYSGDSIIGYPLSRFQVLDAGGELDIPATLQLFEARQKIRIEVTQESPVKLFKIVILNWKKYQSNLAAQAERQRRHRQNRQVSKPTTRQNHLPEGFDEFWGLYPNKKAKQDALKAWRKVKPDERPTVAQALKAVKQTEQWQKDDGKFVPLAASWLNGRRWEDEICPAAPPAYVSDMLTVRDMRPKRPQ